MGCRTSGLSEKWVVREVGCQRSGLSEKWVVREVGCQRSGLSEKWVVREVGCRICVLSDVGCRTGDNAPYFDIHQVRKSFMFLMNRQISFEILDKL